MKLPTQKQARDACINAGADYFVFIQISNHDGKPIGTFSYPCSKRWAQRVSAMTMPQPKERMKR